MRRAIEDLFIIMKNKRLTACLFWTFALLSARGEIEIGFNVDRVYDASGVPVPVTGLGLLIADTGGDGFGSIQPGSLAAGGFVGSADLVLHMADFSGADGTTPGIWFETAAGLILSGAWTQGDTLAFVWFPTLSLSASLASAGDSYGRATFSEWITPSDTSTVVYQLLSGTNNGLFTPSPEFPTLELADVALKASLAVVPEPSSLTLLAGGLGLVVALGTCRRRRLSR